MGYPQSSWLGSGYHGLVIRRKFRLQYAHFWPIPCRTDIPLTFCRLGPLRLGNHLRSLAPLQPRLRHRSRCLFELDVEFHRRANHAYHATKDHLRDIHLLRDLDLRGCSICVARRAGNKKIDA